MVSEEKEKYENRKKNRDGNKRREGKNNFTLNTT